MAVKSRLILSLALTASVLAVSACATKKPPPPVAPSAPPPAAEAPPPPPSRPVTQAPTGPVPGSVEDFVSSAGDRVYFETDMSTLTSDGQRVLDLQASWLNRYPQVTVRIEGNADERGTREYNLALGARRAESVRAYLASHGVAAARMSTISYGKERPIDPGTTEEAWAKNRNGHTAIVSGAR